MFTGQCFGLPTTSPWGLWLSGLEVLRIQMLMLLGRRLLDCSSGLDVAIDAAFINNVCQCLPGAEGMLGNGVHLIPTLMGLRFLEGETDGK